MPHLVIIRPPVLHATAVEGHRHSTWSELFFDLAYVVVIGILGEELGLDLTPAGFLAFLVMFLPVMWSWGGFTVYNDRFDTPDLLHRALTFLQVLGVANLALNTHGNAAGFVEAYVVLRVLLIWQYVRAGRANPAVAALCRHYAAGYALAAACWVATLAAPAWLRPGVWLVPIACDLLTPVTGRRLMLDSPLNPSHVPERFSLFTVILVGLAVAELIHGALGRTFTPGLALADAAGLALVYALWWLYYDNLEGRSLQDTQRAGQIWIYAQTALCIGITVLGVALGRLIAAPMPFPPAREAFAFAAVGCYLALAVLHAIVHCRDMRFKAWSRVAAATCMLPLAWVPLPTAWLLVLAAAVAVVQLGVELKRFGSPRDFMEQG